MMVTVMIMIKIFKIGLVCDADGDGFGLDTLQMESCVRPEGYAERKDDCNDDIQISIRLPMRFVMT